MAPMPRPPPVTLTMTCGARRTTVAWMRARTRGTRVRASEPDSRGVARSGRSGCLGRTAARPTATRTPSTEGLSQLTARRRGGWAAAPAIDARLRPELAPATATPGAGAIVEVGLAHRRSAEEPIDDGRHRSVASLGECSELGLRRRPRHRSTAECREDSRWSAGSAAQACPRARVAT